MTFLVELVVEFDMNTGELYIPSLGLTLRKSLQRNEFLQKNPPIFEPEDSSTIETYYLNIPIREWDRQFMLSVAFQSRTSPFCSGYRMQPIFEDERPQYEETENIQDFRDLQELLMGVFNRAPRLVSEINRAVWKFNWGIASIGTVIQNSSPVAISIGWTSE